MTYEAEAAKPVVRPAWFVFLDIKDDPLKFWTGPMSITLGSGDVGGDTSLQGDWLATGSLVDIGEIVEDENGSGPSRLEMSSVDPALPLFKQIIADGRIWRRRRAVIWMSYMNDAGALAFVPQRKKTGRMDDLRMIQDGASSLITLNVEGYGARSGEASGTRYSEQRDIDPTDKSQDWAADLANKQPDIGASGTGGGGGGSGGGASGGAPNTRLQLK